MHHCLKMRTVALSGAVVCYWVATFSIFSSEVFGIDGLVRSCFKAKPILSKCLNSVCIVSYPVGPAKVFLTIDLVLPIARSG